MSSIWREFVYTKYKQKKCGSQVLWYVRTQNSVPTFYIDNTEHELF